FRHYSSKGAAMRFNSRPRAKALAVGAFAALTATALMACTPSSGDDGQDGGSADGEETLTVWHYYSVDDQLVTLETYKDQFEAAHDGVTVENVYVPQDQIISKVVTAAGT